jgi:3-phosphoinositide dependent protein kinase-1
VVNGGQTVDDKARANEGARKVDDDGIEWAEDAKGPAFERYRLRDVRPLKRTSRIVEEVGPMDEAADYTLEVASSTEGTSTASSQENTKETDEVVKAPVDVITEKTLENDQTKHDTATPTNPGQTPPSIAIPIPTRPTPNNPPGSGTSSSDGSLADKTSVAPAIVAMELNRGRNRALTPVQGNGLLRDADWYVDFLWSQRAKLRVPLRTSRLSLLLPGETALYSTRVEARSPKRRGSRLRLPISVSPMRPKTRQLLLTTHRLLCVKQRDEGGVSLKTELNLRKGVGALSVGGERVPEKEKEKSKDKDRDREKDREKEKDKEAKSIVESAERKGEREFVVLTVSCSLISPPNLIDPN